MRVSNRFRLLLDAGLFLALLVAFFPEHTGISIHEWLSLALIVPALVHLIINWDWVVRATARLLGRLRAATRLNLAIDIALFFATVTVTLSGFMVSQAIASALGVVVVPSMTWHVVHSASADLTLTLTAAHLALHWRWVVRAVTRLAEGLSGGTSGEPCPIPVGSRSDGMEGR